MSMTISQLNDKARDAQNARDLLRKQDAAFKAIIQIMEKSSIEKENLELVRAQLFILSDAQNRAQTELAQYTLLLDDIMRSSQITWPPACLAEN